jgi:hypothetical protein
LHPKRIGRTKRPHGNDNKAVAGLSGLLRCMSPKVAPLRHADEIRKRLLIG